MERLNTAAAISMVFFLAASGVLALVVAWARWVCEPRVEHARDEAERLHRGLLLEAAKWFAEDPQTSKLLEDLATGKDLETIRLDWRTRRARERIAQSWAQDAEPKPETNCRAWGNR